MACLDISLQSFQVILNLLWVVFTITSFYVLVKTLVAVNVNNLLL